ncbi:MAG TPA: J domain-containing protein [Aestuariivirgaceae bacterium]|nr:J domain-containing protein [Aestuariivirgaceae bacterium]
MSDPYQTLGVAKTATQDEIQKAYRRLAKKLHPDLNPGNKAAEEKFKALSVAYDLLSDPEKRARFDRGEIDASGQETPQRRYYRDFAEGAGAGGFSKEGFDVEGGEDIFAEFFGRGARGSRIKIRGQDQRYGLEVDLIDALNGRVTDITMPDGSALKVTIPSGTRDGRILRLKGKGRPGHNGGPPGDALIEIHVRPHKTFTLRGDDIHAELPVSLAEAVLGAKVPAPTPTGPVTLTVPKGSNSGTVLRLKGKGAPRPDGTHGDEYVTLKVMLPSPPDPELERFVASWQGAQSFNPRHGADA